MKYVMDKIICLHCNVPFDSEEHLHKHLRSNKISQIDYYPKYYPRFDKLTGEKIPFKNRESYLHADFLSKANLKHWLLRTDTSIVKEYIRSKILSRKKTKNILYTLSQVELRSMTLPGIAYMNGIFGDYYTEMASLGFINRFDKYRFDGGWDEFNRDHRIIVDTREQMPLNFEDTIKTIHEGLKFGDYKLNDDKFSHNCCIERKSMNDLFGTLSSGLARFNRELKKAKDAGYYVVVLVEEPFLSIYGKSKASKYISPEYICHNMRQIIQDFNNVQFLFVEDRDEASEVILRLFLSNGRFKDTDLQCAYDTGGLI